MKKGFTLVELLGVIIILGAIGLLVVPIIQRSMQESKITAYNTQVKVIEEAANDWALKNSDSLPEKNGDMVTITLGDLKRGGFLPIDIKNPITKELFLNDMVIKIVKGDLDYTIEVDVNSGTNSGNINVNSPVIILNGNYLEYTEITSTQELYEDLGVVAKTSNGSIIDDIEVTYKKGDNEVSNIYTNEYGTYTITYGVNDNGLTTTAIRTVIVRDTTAPEITIPGNLTITLSDINTIDLTTGVSVTDNSGETLSVSTTGNLQNMSGRYIVTYVATDSHGNRAEKRRIIDILDDTNYYTINDLKDNVVTSGDGLYLDSDGVYRYKGVEPNNYIAIGEEYYRIVAIEDQGIKVVMDDSIKTEFDKGGIEVVNCTNELCPRSNSNNTYCQIESGSYQGCNIWSTASTIIQNGNTTSSTLVNGSKTGSVGTNSSVYDTLFEYYSSNLNNLERHIVTNARWNIGPVTYSSVMLLDTVKQGENSWAWNGKVGLLNISDFIQAQLPSGNDYLNCSTNLYKNSSCGVNNWLSSISSWLINPWSSQSINVWYMYNTGYINRGIPKDSGAARPVIYIKNSVQLIGNGTSTYPFMIAENE